MASKAPLLNLLVSLLVAALLSGCTGASNPDSQPGDVAVAESTGEANVAAVSGDSTGASDPFSLRLNTTGNLFVTYVLHAAEGIHCSNYVAAAFESPGDRVNMVHFEGSSGAGFIHSPYETEYLVAGPVDTRSARDGYQTAWSSEISGESWGSTRYVAAVANMAWFDNEITGATFELNISCDGAMDVTDIEMGTTWEGTTAYHMDGSTARVGNYQAHHGSWTTEATGNPKAIVFTSNLHEDGAWSGPGADFEFDGDTRALVHPLGPGTHTVTTTIGSTFPFSMYGWADLEPMDSLQDIVA